MIRLGIAVGDQQPPALAPQERPVLLVLIVIVNDEYYQDHVPFWSGDIINVNECGALFVHSSLIRALTEFDQGRNRGRRSAATGTRAAGAAGTPGVGII